MNKHFPRFGLVVVSYMLFFNACKEDPETRGMPLEVGRYHQGGIIAYIFKEGDSGYIKGEVHGIIAAASDLDTATEWGCYGDTLDGAWGIEIGTGRQNTLDILANCTAEYAIAKLCSDLLIDGYDDWYLPSRMELYQLYLHKEKIGGFKTDQRYWSSSQFNANNAWQQQFSSVQFLTYGKLSACRARAIRNF